MACVGKTWYNHLPESTLGTKWAFGSKFHSFGAISRRNWPSHKVETPYPGTPFDNRMCKSGVSAFSSGRPRSGTEPSTEPRDCSCGAPRIICPGGHADAEARRSVLTALPCATLVTTLGLDVVLEWATAVWLCLSLVDSLF